MGLYQTWVLFMGAYLVMGTNMGTITHIVLKQCTIWWGNSALFGENSALLMTHKWVCSGINLQGGFFDHLTFFLFHTVWANNRMLGR